MINSCMTQCLQTVIKAADADFAACFCYEMCIICCLFKPVSVFSKAAPYKLQIFRLHSLPQWTLINEVREFCFGYLGGMGVAGCGGAGRMCI